MSISKPVVYAQKIQRFQRDATSIEDDLLAVEEPLEILLGFGSNVDRQQEMLSLTMRTPGHDHELVMGFLVTEGIIQDQNQISSIRHCIQSEKNEQGNTVKVELKAEVEIPWEKVSRRFFAHSGCGVCGKNGIEALQLDVPEFPKAINPISPDILYALPNQLQQHQSLFKHTGGLHAAAAFTNDGKLEHHSEDIGRHNAMDKLIGHYFRADQLPLHEHIVLLSGRISYDLVQKAAFAGIRTLVAIGAPSSLAVQLAEKFGICLVGFLKEDRFNVYVGSERLMKP